MFANPSKALLLGCLVAGACSQGTAVRNLGVELYGNFYNDPSPTSPNFGAVDTSHTMLTNGNFETPRTSSWRNTNSAQMPGWSSTGVIEIGKGKIYNPAWGNNQVVELAANIKNSEIHQAVNLQKGHYQIVFNCAARKGVSLQNNAGTVYWNDVLVKTVTSNDYNIHEVSIPVYAFQGVNTIKFQGAGNAQSVGLTIDNVRLHPVRFDQSCYSTWTSQFKQAHPGAVFTINVGGAGGPNGGYGGNPGFQNGRGNGGYGGNPGFQNGYGNGWYGGNTGFQNGYGNGGYGGNTGFQNGYGNGGYGGNTGYENGYGNGGYGGNTGYENGYGNGGGWSYTTTTTRK